MKPGTDYSNTAIALKNPPEVLELLKQWAVYRKHHYACVCIASETPEAKRSLEAAEEMFKAFNKVKAAIDQQGSYQDVAFGLYALKQQRVTTSYDPELVRKHIPDFTAIIEEHVASDKIKGLLRGKLITEEQLADCEVITPLSPAYIVDVLPPVEQVLAREVPNAD